jgi:hypothetical protein
MRIAWQGRRSGTLAVAASSTAEPSREWLGREAVMRRGSWVAAQVVYGRFEGRNRGQVPVRVTAVVLDEEIRVQGDQHEPSRSP